MESFEDAVTQTETAPKLLAIIPSAVARDTTVMAPIAWYGAMIVKQEVEESGKDLVLTPPWPHRRIWTCRQTRVRKAAETSPPRGIVDVSRIGGHQEKERVH